ncbi:hypothetical protein MTO96_007576 [Rhipicephalus appendiculatus]
MAPKRRRAATPHRAAKNTTASSTTVTAVVGLPVTTAGPLQYPAPGDDDEDSSCSNSSFYTSTTLSYSSSSSSDEEVETMRCFVNREEHSDSLDGASSYSSVIQPGDSCLRATARRNVGFTPRGCDKAEWTGQFHHGRERCAHPPVASAQRDRWKTARINGARHTRGDGRHLATRATVNYKYCTRAVPACFPAYRCHSHVSP